MTDLGIPGVGEATLIASGGSALVYQALSGTGDPLAVKVLRGIRGNEVTRRFERELSAAERLQGHPNIMRIHHTGINAAGEPYLVMPLVEGGSLDDELERNGAFSLQQATRDVAEAADALEFAHERGVLHRDIKPANLLRGANGSIIVTDFGIARVVDAGITSATMGASTPLYAAPEILTENLASARSEVYSLGALLYALLAGTPAFAGDNIWSTLNRIRTEMPPPIPGVPAPVMRVITQAMAKDAAFRPASPAQFRENLRAALTAPDTWHPPSSTVDLPAELDHGSPIEVTVPAVEIASTTEVTAPIVPAPSNDHLQAPAPMRPEPPRPGRSAPALGTAPERDRSTARLLAGLAALALVAGLAYVGTTWLLDQRTSTAGSAAPPVDNSLPSPTPGSPTDAATQDPDENDDGVSLEDLPDAGQAPTTFVSFTGQHFSALLPEGWAVSASDIEEPYGFRSMFVTEGMYLNIDTTPKEQRTGGDIRESAIDIAAAISTASEVRTETVDGLTMHSFTFRNDQGVDSIDIFFEVDGDGYAIVAGSASNPQGAFATARLVALSVRSNPN